MQFLIDFIKKLRSENAYFGRDNLFFKEQIFYCGYVKISVSEKSMSVHVHINRLHIRLSVSINDSATALFSTFR